MNSGISMRGLPNIRELFSQKEQEFIQALGYLQLSDIQSDTAFQTTKQKIKDRILLTPVVFADPVPVSQRPARKKIPPNKHHRQGHAIDTLIVKINFPFTGTPNLFGFAPPHLHIHPFDTRVFQPEPDHTISIEVEVEELDKTVVLHLANEAMHTTFSLIRQINPHAEE